MGTKNEQKCIFCGGQLSFDGEEMVGTWRTGYDGDKDAMIHYMQCRQCGRDYEVFDPPKKDRKGLYKDYWKEH